MWVVGEIWTELYAFLAGVAVVIRAKRALAGRSTSEMAPDVNAPGFFSTRRRAERVGVGPSEAEPLVFGPIEIGVSMGVGVGQLVCLWSFQELIVSTWDIRSSLIAK